jgi:predicted AlkP superfamily pyrophosphatase or phosphodiesterase
MVANGLWDERFAQVRFWEQSARLVAEPRIWEGFRRAGRRVAMLFWQQSLGEEVDGLISPAPIHQHHGGLVQDCYSRPRELYARMRGALGRGFNLAHYWGPRASAKSSQWIAEATAWLMASDAAPDLCLTYLPALDYDLQRFGPGHLRARQALAAAWAQLDLLRRAADAHGYELLVFGDYAIGPCSAAVYPNRALRQAGLLATRSVRGRLYPDFHAADAFVVADHEVAQVYVRRSGAADRVRRVFEGLPGIEGVLAGECLQALRLDHAHAGDMVLVAQAGRWFAYPWWDDPREEPDYARHVDIHGKPGYDPCELFFGWPPGSVSRNPDRIRGTHGKTGPNRQVAWTATFLNGEAESLIRLAAETRQWMDSQL